MIFCLFLFGVVVGDQCEDRILWQFKDCIASNDAAPRDIPLDMLDAFSRHGKIDIGFDLFIDDSYGGKGSNYGYSAKDIASYGTRNLEAELWEILLKYRDELIKGKVVGVVGSQKPVVESMLLRLGAAHVNTLEYNSLTLNDRRISVFKGNRFPFEVGVMDLIVASDALQHDGLGRYNDPLCPDADLLTADYLAGVGRYVIFSVPTGNKDLVECKCIKLIIG